MRKILETKEKQRQGTEHEDVPPLRVLRKATTSGPKGNREHGSYGKLELSTKNNCEHKGQQIYQENIKIIVRKKCPRKEMIKHLQGVLTPTPRKAPL